MKKFNFFFAGDYSLYFSNNLSLIVYCCAVAAIVILLAAFSFGGVSIEPRWS